MLPLEFRHQWLLLSFGPARSLLLPGGTEDTLKEHLAAEPLVDLPFEVQTTEQGFQPDPPFLDRERFGRDGVLIRRFFQIRR
jgi:hypothetical protein